jgi:hypothetical protein
MDDNADCVTSKTVPVNPLSRGQPVRATGLVVNLSKGMHRIRAEL